MTNRKALALLIAMAGVGRAAAPMYPNRWVWVPRNLVSDEEVNQIRQIARTASEHGMTAIVLNGGTDLLGPQGLEIEDRLRQVKKICDGYGLELIPAVFSVGWGGVIVHDRNLAEGLPVRDALFVAAGGQARLAPDQPVGFVNGGFEQHRGDNALGWGFHDAPGQVSFIDTSTFVEGSASLRFEVARSTNSLARVMQEVTVKPHRAYRVSFQLKTQGLRSPGSMYLKFLVPGDRDLAGWNIHARETSDWHRVTWGFNSQDNAKVRIYLGTWGAGEGRFWVDDFRLEEISPLNVLRRTGTPITVRNDADGTVYQEGKDYAPINDGNLARELGYDHDPPPIRLQPHGRIHDGDRLQVSYYQGMELANSQVSVCMSEPKLYKIFAEQAKLLHKAIKPSKYLLSMDEVRVAASCDACKQRGISAAEILGDCITREMAILRHLNPNAEIFCWSDMLDPNHNAVNHFYLVDGDFTGSWKFVPKDLGIVDWNYDRRAASLAHFSSLGFHTVAGAYYDADNLDNPKAWLELLKKTPGASGMMYTTFENKYGLLGAFGDLVSQPLPQ